MAKPTDTQPGQARDDRDSALASWARRALSRKLGALPPASELDDELLARYIDGSLSDSERTKLEQALLTDLDAKERVGIVASALRDAGFGSPAPTEGMATKATRYVFHVAAGVLDLLRGEGVSALEPAMAVRSGHFAALGASSAPTAFQIEREFPTAQGIIAARFELHAERAQSEALVDLVVHVGHEGHATSGIRVKLLRDGRPVDSREIEEQGCTFAHLDPARYDLELRKGGVEIGRLLLDLRG